MRYIKKSQVCGNSSIFSNKADGAILTSASSLQSSFSSNSCQFQSISTFFLCDWMTSFWILFALSFLFLSSRVRRFLSNSSVSVLILTIRSSVLRRTCSNIPIKVVKWSRLDQVGDEKRLTFGIFDLVVTVRWDFLSLRGELLIFLHSGLKRLCVGNFS